jgi:hypothetical protein
MSETTILQAILMVTHLLLILNSKICHLAATSLVSRLNYLTQTLVTKLVLSGSKTISTLIQGTVFILTTLNKM